MTTEEVKKAIERKINEIDHLKLELTELIFSNPEIIEDDENNICTKGYIGGFKVNTKNKVLRFAVNEKGWLTSYDNYLAGVEELPCVKSFVILKENKSLKKEIDDLKGYVSKLLKGAE